MNSGSSASTELKEASFINNAEDCEMAAIKADRDQFSPLELRRIRSGAIDMSPDEQEEEVEKGMSRAQSLNPDIVAWDGPDDPENPFNWKNSKKWFITMVAALVTFCVALASSIFTAGITEIAADFNVSRTVITLGLTFYVMGFATGPLVFAPMSEVYGRNLVYRSSWIFFMLFQIGCALAPNAATLLVCRLISGIAGSSPISNAGGTLSDMWRPAERGTAMSFFIGAPFAGPVLGPIIGGFLVEYVSWRWTFWLILIISGVQFIVLLFLMPETYGRTLLERKAARLRKETGNMNLHAAHETTKISHFSHLRVSIVRPVYMLFTEPIVLCIAVYCALIYAILYMNFIAYPVVFQDERGWGAGTGGLPFLGLGFGIMCGICTAPAQTRLYVRLTKERGDGMIYPEGRLPYSIAGAIILPIGILWFGWGSLLHVHWIVSTIGGAVFGFGLILVFLSMFSYLVDAYLIYAASALAGNSLLRSILGATFPLFADQMFTKLTPKWACTLLACLAFILAPIPYFFYKFGPRIRALSKMKLTAPSPV
ncbi:major facilitator superfamily domain-containing protein [Limtongia smithiae]|uniref:major facilitator superfamily domain-containing protein n=1 Tax=Limtongia smithiae TaxID=1125753 RepID=UPI0034CEE757